MGAVLANETTMASYGYNGTLPGAENVCEGADGRTHDGVIHAEENAILKLANTSEKASDMSMFVTCAPCAQCANKIVMAGIKEVYFRDFYRSLDGVKRLLNHGVSLYKVDGEQITNITWYWIQTNTVNLEE